MACPAVPEICSKLPARLEGQDDFGGYKAGFGLGLTEIGCMAHTRRNSSSCMRRTKAQLPNRLCTTSNCFTSPRPGTGLPAPNTARESRPVMDKLYAWMIAQLALVPEGSVLSKALEYSLKR